MKKANSCWRRVDKLKNAPKEKHSLLKKPGELIIDGERFTYVSLRHQLPAGRRL